MTLLRCAWYRPRNKSISRLRNPVGKFEIFTVSDDFMKCITPESLIRTRELYEENSATSVYTHNTGATEILSVTASPLLVSN
jgi:hypothetical protein